MRDGVLQLVDFGLESMIRVVVASFHVRTHHTGWKRRRDEMRRWEKATWPTWGYSNEERERERKKKDGMEEIVAWHGRGALWIETV